MMTLAGLNGSCSAATPESTASERPPTSVPSAISTSTHPSTTNTVEFRFNSSCWPVIPLQEGNDIKGSLVCANFAPHSTETNHIFLWDVSSFHGKAITTKSKIESSFGDTRISSDGKFIAKIFRNTLMLLSFKEERSFPLQNEYVASENYLPDGHILLIDYQNRNLHDHRYERTGGFTDIYYLLDPATGEVTKHSIFLPHTGSNAHGNVVVKYSPNMKYVLYRSESDEADIKFTLYDLDKDKVVWVGPSRDTNLKNYSDTIPAWLPDSSALITQYFNGTSDNYYSISLDGKVSPITNFENISLLPTFSWTSSWSYHATFPNQSPNGRYLVSSGLQSYGNPAIYIWDNKEKEGYLPCLPDEGRSASAPYFTNWSYGTDGSYFLMYLSFATPTPINPDDSFPMQFFKGYILDLDHRIIYEMPEESNINKLTNTGGNNEFLGWVNWEIP